MATVLIVDDRASNRERLISILSDRGYRVLEAADGPAALELAREERPNLILADVLMPTMDGGEFVRRLHAIPGLAPIPVILCTAPFHEPEILGLARAQGAVGVLLKPFESEPVLQLVAAALANEAAIALMGEQEVRSLTYPRADPATMLRRTNDRLSAVLELSLQIGSERDLDRVLQSFAHAAREIVCARYAIVGIGSAPANGRGERMPLKMCVTSGLDAAAVLRLGTPRLGQCRLSHLLKGSLRGSNPGGRPVDAGFGDRLPPIHSWLGSPVRSISRTYGFVLLIDKLGAEEFRDEDERLLTILAAQVGRVYETGSLYRDAVRRSEELLQKLSDRSRAEHRFRALVESAPDAMVIVDANGRIALANQRTESLFGYRRSELIGRPVDVLLPERTFGRLGGRPGGSAASLTDTPPPGEAMELLGRRKDGVEFPAEINRGPLHTEDGENTTLVIRNISARRKSEAALRASEESLREIRRRLEHIIASNPAVLYSAAVDDDRVRAVAWISDNVRDMMGYTPSEALDRDWWFGNIHPADSDRARDTLHRALSAQGHAIDEYRFRYKDGAYRWVRCDMRLLRDPSGRPIEVVGSWSDITERKHLEDQILQSQKMEAIGKLAGGIAHDFNNLLTIINGYCELLLDEHRAGDGDFEPLGEIHKAGERAATLTRQLLAFSRKAVLNPVVVDVNALVLDLQKMLGRLIGEDIELKPVLKQAGKVKVDPGQMEQVIMNLVVNARDAMPRGGTLLIETATVDLDDSYAATHPDALPGSYVLIAVSDTGVGMDAATRARIFDPFFTTKGPDQGTGLGLSVVHGIVKQSGGRIEVYSELGIGTTFKIYLPRTRETAPASRMIHPAVVHGGSETILLVEDEAGVRSLTRLILERHGYKVVEARNGEEAIEASRDHAGTIHLMVSDAVMPRLSGWQVAQQLAATRPGMKVLFLSGYTDDAIMHHGIIDPNTPFLQKPFTSDSLALKVRELLDDPPRGSEA